MQQTRFFCAPYFCNLAALHNNPLTLFLWVRTASNHQTPMGKTSTNRAPPDTQRGARTLLNLTKESHRFKSRHTTSTLATSSRRGSNHQLRGERRAQIMSSADNLQNNPGTVSPSHDWGMYRRSSYNQQSSLQSRNWNSYNFRQETEPWPSNHQPRFVPPPRQTQVRGNYARTPSRDMQQNNTFLQGGGYYPPPSISNTFQRAAYHYQFGYANNQAYGSYGFNHQQQQQQYNPQRHYFQAQQIPSQNYGLFQSRNWENGSAGDDRRYSTFSQGRILSTNVFQREWEEIQSANSFATTQSVLGTDKSVKISVMCYNVLAPTLQKEHGYLYKECDPEAVKWSYRRRCFHKELELYRPDVVCLQEVEADLIQDYNHFFQQLGYKGLFKKRTGDKCDGCAIYFCDSKFNLVDSISVEYLQKSVPLLNRDNIGLVAKLETKCDLRHKFVVATTHLLFNLHRTDVKIAQGTLLLAELDRIACYGIDENGSPLYYPTIVTGDFNSEPSFAVPQLMTGGQINLDKTFLNSRSKGAKFGSSRNNEFLAQLGITQRCQHYELVQQRGQIKPDMELHTSDSAPCINLSKSTHCGHDENFAEIFYSNTNSSSRSSNRQSSSSSIRNAKPLPVLHRIEPNNSTVADINNLQSEENQGELVTHAFGFNDVYGFATNDEDLNTYVTTKQSKWVRVDYIYYSTTNQRCVNANGTREEGSLKLLRRLKLPTSAECKKSGKIPQEGASSDHYPLLAEFLLTPLT
ncbi:protein angel homolog 2 isoform X2 [Folsomia candida]|uniref:protein angel homolog 2 isoform X2 n=1 Tax=Folsomia candida TaxID=158441 RepID=UPI000B8FDF21|nr:protein angel homolog 2 isoform X2 [Folsomia candida]